MATLLAGKPVVERLARNLAPRIERLKAAPAGDMESAKQLKKAEQTGWNCAEI